MHFRGYMVDFWSGIRQRWVDMPVSSVPDAEIAAMSESDAALLALVRRFPGSLHPRYSLEFDMDFHIIYADALLKEKMGFRVIFETQGWDLRNVDGNILGDFFAWDSLTFDTRYDMSDDDNMWDMRRKFQKRAPLDDYGTNDCRDIGHGIELF